MRVAGYTWNADTYCVDCTKTALTEGMLYTPNTYGTIDGDEHGIPFDAIDTFGETIFPIFTDSEWDYVVHCECGEEIETKVLVYF